MKICVYAICKNESKNLDRWIDSVAYEADYIAILDTGSTDGTFERLCNYSDNSFFLDSWGYKAKIFVEQFDYQKEFGIMKFDKARNDSLKLVPNDTDVCFRLDFDEIPVKGWSEIIKQRFNEGFTEVLGECITFDEDGNETKRWKTRNVHPNNPHWIWTRVIHEVISYFGNDEKSEVKQVFDERFIINHFPDKSKDRTFYIELLKYSCKEFPKDPIYGTLLGVEFAQYGKTSEAIEAFERCLNECDFSNNEECEYQTLLNLAELVEDFHLKMNFISQAKQTGIKCRRIYKILADIFEKQGKFDDAIEALENALKDVPTYSSAWYNDKQFFGGYIEDRLSLFYYYQKQNPLKALEFCSKALQLDPNNSRIKRNLDFYYKDFLKIIIINITNIFNISEAHY